ncbi:MAG: DUF2238 domain-containing protein [Acidobacteriota bacterium]
MSKDREVVLLTVLLLGLFVLWGVNPKADRFTWFLENAPVIAGVALLAATYRRYPMSRLIYRLVFLHAIILMLGGHYSYARVPLGDWVRDWLDLERNHYDRLGHLAQGFFPAIITREILLRSTPLAPGGWLFAIVTSIGLAISALYELIEWWVAAGTGTAAMEFLGTQGDVWDSQWDMMLALIGAVAAQLLLSRVHDRGLASTSKQPRR